MSQGEHERQDDNMKRLLEISKPKRRVEQFQGHPYNEGRYVARETDVRFNYNHYDGRLHENPFCPTVKGLSRYLLGRKVDATSTRQWD